MAVTIREVAERAGVSTATVSYVLNGRSAKMRIADETRERILTAVRELDYHPNALARGLAHKSTRTIAVVMQYPTLFSGWSGFTNALMHGVTDAAIAQDYDVLLHTRRHERRWRGEEADVVASEVAMLTDGRVDGALLLRDVDDPLAEALHQRGFPAVLMFTHTAGEHLWFVDCDNVAGSRLATEHLLRLGHERIAHLSGPLRSGAGQERREGYMQAMRAAGRPTPADWMVEVAAPEGDFAPAVALFNLPPAQRPTAFFAWSDDVALTMIGILRSRGFQVPKDVAIVGFDSTELCEHTDPPLTSVRQPIYDMAAQAMTLLTNRLKGERPGQTQMRVPPSLDVRRSCGADTEPVYCVTHQAF